MSEQCCVPGCFSVCCPNTEKGITFHKFPLIPELGVHWKRLINNKSMAESEDTRICSKHFEASDFVNNDSCTRRLKVKALPSIFPYSNQGERNVYVPIPRPCTALVKDPPERRKCCISACKANEESPGINLYSFPDKLSTANKWLRYVRLHNGGAYQLAPGMSVCSRHFQPEHFGPNGELLTEIAIPQLFPLKLPRAPPNEIEQVWLEAVESEEPSKNGVQFVPETVNALDKNGTKSLSENPTSIGTQTADAPKTSPTATQFQLPLSTVRYAGEMKLWTFENFKKFPIRYIWNGVQILLKKHYNSKHNKKIMLANLRRSKASAAKMKATLKAAMVQSKTNRLGDVEMMSISTRSGGFNVDEVCRFCFKVTDPSQEVYNKSEIRGWFKKLTGEELFYGPGTPSKCCKTCHILICAHGKSTCGLREVNRTWKLMSTIEHQQRGKPSRQEMKCNGNSDNNDNVVKDTGDSIKGKSGVEFEMEWLEGENTTNQMVHSDEKNPNCMNLQI